MFKPRCSLREMQKKIFYQIELADRVQRDQEEFSQRPPLMDAGFQPTPLHAQHLAQSNAEWQTIIAQRSQMERAEYEARLQEPQAPSDVDIARGQLITAKSLLIGTKRKRY